MFFTNQTFQQVLRQRELHQRRSILTRIGFALAGCLISVVGAVLLVLLPELGLPILLVGLRLLAYKFYWAARAYAWVAALAERFRGWYRSLPLSTRRSVVAAIVLLALVGLVAALGWAA